MLSGKKYNPEDISQYFGKTFITESGSRYSITSKGTITGRESVENYQVELIAGLEDQEFSELRESLCSREILDLMIRESGKEIKEGLHLAVSLTKDSELTGLSTGKIISIEDTL
jgi:hypothetical protein